MSAGEAGTKAVVAALVANLFITIAKLVGYIITGAASMIAETLHSLADTGNQALLLLGGKLAKRAPTEHHPFGYGRERYFWAFVVAMVLFSLGSLFALYEGVHKYLTAGEHGEPQSFEVAIVILAVAIVAETLSFRTAIRAARPLKGDASWPKFIRRTKNPELATVLLEDLGALLGLVFALIGVSLTAITHDARYDAVGSIVIGLLLGFIAITLAIENKSFLIGEGADPTELEKVRDAITSAPGVRHLINIRTLHLGPEELLVAAKIEFEHGHGEAGLSNIINETESRIRAQVPTARLIFLEPDQLRI